LGDRVKWMFRIRVAEPQIFGKKVREKKIIFQIYFGKFLMQTTYAGK